MISHRRKVMITQRHNRKEISEDVSAMLHGAVAKESLLAVL